MKFPKRPRRRAEAELDQEIQAHLRMAAADRIERGENPHAALLAARRELGNEGIVKEVTRQVWGWQSLDRHARDLRYAIRMLRKNPGFAAVVVSTLALGIGANTAIFSVIRAALSPMAISAPDRAVILWTENPRRDWHQFPSSAPDFLDYQASGAFSSLTGFTDSGMNIRFGNRTDRIDGFNVTPEYFDVFASPPQLGRLFRADDDPAANNSPVILSDELWRSHFAADPSVIGSSIVVDGEPHTIAGVLSRDFPQLGLAKIYRLLDLGRSTDRGTRFMSVAGRLRPGVTLAAAQQRVAAVSRRLAGQFPDTNEGVSAALQPIEEAAVQDAGTLLLVLFGAVGFVLLIACANIANLLLARGAARTREMTIRSALGASRWTLSRQLLTESLCMSLAGGLLAVLPTLWAIHIIASFRLNDLPNPDSIVLDRGVLAFNLLLSFATGILCGLAPAWQLRTVSVNDTLKAAGRGNTGGSNPWLRGLLVVAEMALTVVLLVGAGLLLRSVIQLRTRNPGYDPHNVITMRIALAEKQYADPKHQAAFFDRVLQGAAALPGALAAAGTHELPTSDSIHGSGLHFPDRPEPRPGDVPISIVTSVTPAYFRAMRVPLVRGRYFSDSDRPGAPLTAIIDEWTARRHWPNQDPIGHRFNLGPKESERVVVGVVKDVELGVMLTLVKGRFAQVYLPFAQAPKPQMSLVFRTAGDPTLATTALRDLVRGLDPDEPVFDVRTMEEARVAGRSSLRLATWLVGAFAAVAVLLAAIGIYGVMAFHVGRRLREFGIRMSLGAQPRDVWIQVVRQALALNSAGIALGLIGAFALTRLMATLLYGVRVTDPLTFAAVAASLLLVALAAAYIPARRATRVDPVQALRDE